METPRRFAVAGATGKVGRHAVEVLEDRGHDVVPISRSTGVDVVTGEGLAEALSGVEAVIDATAGASPEQQAATEFFTTAAGNLQQAGDRAGVKRIVVASIIGIDRFTAGYGAAKQAHEQATLAGPIPALILRAAQFHELVAQLVYSGKHDGVSYLPKMRTQLVAARTVAEALADLVIATAPPRTSGSNPAPIPEIAGPREESLVEIARLLVASSGDDVQIEGVNNPADPDGELYEAGALLPSPHAILAGPTYEEWLGARATGEDEDIRHAAGRKT